MAVWEYIPTGKQSAKLIENDLDETTERMKVPGGWLVRTTFARETYGLAWGLLGSRMAVSTSITYYPDPSHSWNAY